MRKLLIIDDNLDFLGFLTSALEKYFEVYTATGVKDALRLLEHQKVEAICSDYNMKDGTGLELLEVILSRLVDTFFSRISLTMQPPPKPHSTACVLPWEEGRHWQSRSSGCSSS